MGEGVARVRLLERRVRSDRAHVNDLLSLLQLVAPCRAESVSRLAAVQACRALFLEWAGSGELLLRAPPASGGARASRVRGAPGGGAQRFRAWLLAQYRRFVELLQKMLGDGDESLDLRVPALDSLLQLAGAEVRHTRPGEAHVRALDAAGGALRALVVAIATSERAEPALLARLRERGLSHLDVRFYVLRHVKRLAKPAGLPPRHGRPQRLVELLMCVRPPARDVAPADASFVGAGGDVAGAPRLPASARRLLSAARHRVAFCASWRAVLALPLPPSTMRSVLPWLPEAVFPHVPRPARYCDLLNGNADPEKEAPACARVHAGTPTDTPSPQCCTLTRRRLRARRRAGDARASRAVRPHDAPRPRVPALLPASVRAHHPVRAQRHAPSCLHRSPAGLRAHPWQRTAAPLATPPILLPCCSLSQTPPPPSFAPQLFLSSSGLPNYLVAAFAKRLGRLALTAPAPTAVLALGIVYNLLLQHKAVRILIHRRADAEVIAAPACPEAAASSDTFVESEDDPAACRAIDSCLWEVDSLRSHMCPTVASVASLFCAPMTLSTPPVDLRALGLAAAPH